MTYTWDSDNKLRSADIDANGTADVNFQYDALGRRVARTGTGGSVVFVQMDQQTIADYPVGGAASTPTYRYVYASYIDEPVVRKGAGTGGTIHYYHRNQQYSVTAITTAAGAIAERYAYTAYGLPTILNASATIIASSAISNRYTYTGREWDATLSLHHFRARWMSPAAGRFLGRDPIGYQGSEWGLYELFDASVLTSTDPLGLFSGTCTCHCGGGPSRHGIPVQVTPACGGNADSCCRKACDTIMTFCVYRALPGEDGGISGTIYVPAEFENGRYKCPYPNRCHERLEHLACGYFPTKCSKIACKLACGTGGIACGAACDRLFGGSPNPRKIKALMACRVLCGAVALGCSISCESCENP